MTSTGSASTFVAILDADNATSAMRVELRAVNGRSAVLAQPILPWHATATGLASPAALGPMIDAALGSAVHLSDAPARSYVMASLTASFVADLNVGDVATATSAEATVDRRTDTVLSTGRIEGPHGLVASIQCRAVPVTRSQRTAGTVGPSTGAALAHHGPHNGEALGNGPFASVLGLTTHGTGETGATGTWETDEWMSNPLGTVQGGAVFAALAEATLIGVRGIAKVDSEVIALSEMTVDLLRSPLVGQRYRWTTSITRAGRRLVTATTRITDDHGIDVARAHSAALRHRQASTPPPAG